MSRPDFEKFAELLRVNPRFTLETYRFISEAMEYANKQSDAAVPDGSDLPPIIQALAGQENPVRHLSGQELCYAVRDYALEQYGLMARQVLARLGLCRTRDVGEAVFNLVKVGYIKQSPCDSLNDFDNLFDLARDLDRGFSFADDSLSDRLN